MDRSIGSRRSSKRRSSRDSILSIESTIAIGINRILKNCGTCYGSPHCDIGLGQETSFSGWGGSTNIPSQVSQFFRSISIDDRDQSIDWFRSRSSIRSIGSNLGTIVASTIVSIRSINRSRSRNPSIDPIAIDLETIRYSNRFSRSMRSRSIDQFDRSIEIDPRFRDRSKIL